MNTTCPLCLHTEVVLIDSGKDIREYLKCGNCHLIYVKPDFLPSADQEKDRYLHHNNSLHNEGYVKFLNQIVEPSLAYLTKEMVGLDYGCGSEPVLINILKDSGIKCYNYDPFFFPTLPLHSYDFIFSTEAFEHFFSPKKEIESISTLLKTGGYLFIMTERYDNPEQFKTWYYKRDMTHVVFYQLKTFEYICEEYGFEMLYKDEKRVVVLRKK